MYSDLQDKKTTKELLKKYEGKTVPKIFTFSGTNEVWAVDVPEAKMLALKYTSDFRNPVGIFLNIFGCEWHWAEEEGTDMDKVETRFNLLKREEEKDAKNALNDEELMEIAECFFEKSEVGVFSLSLDRNSKMKLAKELEEIGFVLIEKPKFKESIKEYHNFLLVKKNNELAEKGERLAWTSQSDL
jgi:hypothetical protein